MVSDSSDTYRIVTELDHCASHLQILRDEELLKGLYSCTVVCGSSTYTTTCPVTSFLHQSKFSIQIYHFEFGGHFETVMAAISVFVGHGFSTTAIDPFLKRVLQ